MHRIGRTWRRIHITNMSVQQVTSSEVRPPEDALQHIRAQSLDL